MKQVYFKYPALKIDQTRHECKLCSAIARRDLRKIKQNIWDKYISDIEHKAQGREGKAYKILWHLNQTKRDNLKISNNTEKEWLRYYERL